MIDPTPAQLATLDPQIRGRAITLLNALRAVGVPAIIGPLGARRSQAEQMALLADPRGVTSTSRSRHLMGMAFDIDVLGVSRDRIPEWWWPIIGNYAESALGLRWGGRWTRPYDPGHFEL